MEWRPQQLDVAEQATGQKSVNYLSIMMRHVMTTMRRGEALNEGGTGEI